SGQRSQRLLLLRFAAKEEDRLGPQRGMRLHGDTNGDIAARDFLNGEAVGEEIGSRASIFFGEWQSQQPQLAHLVNKVIGEISRAIHFFRTWSNLLLRKISAGIANRQLLFIEREVHTIMLLFLWHMSYTNTFCWLHYTWFGK